MNSPIQQGSPEWLALRAGKLTASCFGDAISMKEEVVQKKTKDQERITRWVPTDTRNRCMREVIAEILSGEPYPQVQSASLNWGKELESFARDAYELHSGNLVRPGGFVIHHDYPFIGASPDGLIDDDGGYESKCPKDMQVHIKTLQQGMPDEHIPQVQGGMFVTGRRYWVFVSYDPRQAEPYRLYVQRIERDDKYIDTVLKPGLLQFWAELQQEIEVLRNKAA